MLGQHKRIIAAVGEDAFAAETTRRMPLVLDDASLYGIATPLGFQMTWLSKGKAKPRSVVTATGAGGDIATVLSKAGPPPASVGVVVGGSPPAMVAAAPGIVAAIPPPPPAMRPLPAGQSAPVAAAAAVPKATALPPAVVPVARVAAPAPRLRFIFTERPTTENN